MASELEQLNDGNRKVKYMNLKTIESHEALTASECMLKHGLNWRVQKASVFVDGKRQNNMVAIKREDTDQAFQIASERYEPIQNADAFSFFDEITKTGQAKYVSAGQYPGGGVIWLRAKLPCDFEVLPGDSLKTYLKIVTSHDGSQRLAIYPEVYRQICSNGMHALVKQHAKSVSVKHTENASVRFLFNAKQVLADEIAYFTRFSEACRIMAKKDMDRLAIDSFLYELFETDSKEAETKTLNQMSAIKTLALRSGIGLEIPGVKGTAWAVHNGVTEFVDNYKPTKGDNRDYSADFGTGADMRERAFALLTR